MRFTQRKPIPWLASVGLVAVFVAGTQASIWAFAALIRGLGIGPSWADAYRSVTSNAFALAVGQALAVTGALVLGVWRYGGGRPSLEVLRLEPRPPPLLALSFVAGVGLQFPLTELGNLAQEVFPRSLEQQWAMQRMLFPDGPLPAVLTMVAVVVLAPLFEELLFRGLLLPGLAELYGSSFAVGLTALLFGAIHFNSAAVAYAVVGGVVLGVLAVRTGSTLIPVAVHAGVNATPLLLPPSLVSIPGFNTIAEGVAHLSPLILLPSTCVAAAALFAVVRLANVDSRL